MSNETLTAAAERLNAARHAFYDLNRVLPPGVQGFEIPPTVELAAQADAIAAVLLSKGLITEDELVEAKTVRMAEIIEEMVEQARELKRQALGLITAPGAARH